MRWRDVVLLPGAPESVALRAEAAAAAARRGSMGRSRLDLEVRGNLVIAEVRLLSR